MNTSVAYAKVSSEGNQDLYKLSSGSDLFPPLNIPEDKQSDYSPEYKLESDEWYKIDEFSRQGFCPDFLKGQLSSLDYTRIDRDLIQEILYIFSVQSGDFYFQKMTPTKFVAHKNFLKIPINAEPKLQVIKDSVSINSIPDALYLRSKDRLIFKRLSNITKLFNGIDVLYREATNEEVEHFSKSKFIKLDTGFEIDDIGKSNRAKITRVLERLNNLSDYQLNIILKEIPKYAPTLVFDEENLYFKISKNKELEQLLTGLLEEYYTKTDGERRKVNSSKKIS